MKNTILLLNGLWLLGLVACQPKSSSLSECPIVNVRSALQEETPISMKEDVVEHTIYSFGNNRLMPD